MVGRHSAPRRRGPLLVLGVVALVGSAGLTWVLDGGPVVPRPRTTTPAPVVQPGAPVGIGTAPTPWSTSTAAPVVRVVAEPVAPPATGPPRRPAGPTTAAVPPPVSGTPPTTSAPTRPAPTAPAPSATPRPTRTKPGRGRPPSTRPTPPPRRQPAR